MALVLFLLWIASGFAIHFAYPYIAEVSLMWKAIGGGFVATCLFRLGVGYSAETINSSNQETFSNHINEVDMLPSYKIKMIRKGLGYYREFFQSSFNQSFDDRTIFIIIALINELPSEVTDLNIRDEVLRAIEISDREKANRNMPHGLN